MWKFSFEYFPPYVMLMCQAIKLYQAQKKYLAQFVRIVGTSTLSRFVSGPNNMEIIVCFLFWVVIILWVTVNQIYIREYIRFPSRKAFRSPMRTETNVNFGFYFLHSSRSQDHERNFGFQLSNIYAKFKKSKFYNFKHASVLATIYESIFPIYLFLISNECKVMIAWLASMSTCLL
jgi:hypothetical protein